MNNNQYIVHGSSIQRRSYSQEQINKIGPKLDSAKKEEANKRIALEKELAGMPESVRRQPIFVREAWDYSTAVYDRKQLEKEQAKHQNGLKREQAAQRSYAHRNGSHSPVMMDTSKPITYAMNGSRMAGAKQSYANRNHGHKPELLFGKPNSRIVRKR